MAGERPTSGMESKFCDLAGGRTRSLGSDSARPTMPISSLRSNGFGRYSYAPFSDARTAVMNVFCALMMHFLDARQQVEGILVRHHHVGDDEITVPLTDPAPQCRGVAGRADFVAS